MTNPGLTRRHLLEIYHFMTLNRRVEERLTALFRQGKIVGGMYRSLGQEATSVGTAYALEPDDLLAPLIRNLGSCLVRGYTPRELFLQYLARADGPCRGKDNNLHFADPKRGVIGCISMLGTLIPVMMGVALAARMKREGRVALTYIGDGGTSTGDFHEGMNFAAVRRAPLIVVIENNGYAYSTPVVRQAALKDLAQRALAYGVPSEIVDGNDVLAVIAATRRAADRARSGEGPTLLEAKTFRMLGHAQHDDQAYVPAEKLQEWRARDPIQRYREWLLNEEGIEASELEGMDGEIAVVVEEAAATALEAPMPQPATALEGVLATSVEHIAETAVTPGA